MNILHLGCGKDWKRELGNSSTGKYDDVYHIFVDKLFEGCEDLGENFITYGDDIFKFLEGYDGANIDKIIAHRVFEHIDFKDISYLLYLLHEVAANDCILDIIVPDYDKVAFVISSLDPEKMTAKEFNLKMIQCHTEVFNEPYDPHRSIWTQALAKYYLELEGYWSIKKKAVLTDVFSVNKYLEDYVPSIETIQLDNRKWYIRIISSVVKSNDIMICNEDIKDVASVVIDSIKQDGCYRKEDYDKEIKREIEGFPSKMLIEDLRKMDGKKNYTSGILDGKTIGKLPTITEIANSNFGATVQMLDDGTLKPKENKIIIARECIKKEPEADKTIIVIPDSVPLEHTGSELKPKATKSKKVKKEKV